MTYHIDQVQSMIAEIDRVLRQTQSWNPWKLWKRCSVQRYTLERIRNFLILQQRPAGSPALSIAAKSEKSEPSEMLMREIHALTAQRDALKAERAALKSELQTLEQSKQMQLQWNALHPTGVPAQILTAPMMSSAALLREGFVTGQVEGPVEGNQLLRSALLEQQQLDRLEALRDRADLMLSSLDQSLQLTFDSLLKNVEVYNTSLGQGIDRMHGLGYQGEVLFSALVNHLAQNVGQELAKNTTTRPIDRFLTDLPPAPASEGNPSAPSSEAGQFPSASTETSSVEMRSTEETRSTETGAVDPVSFPKVEPIDTNAIASPSDLIGLDETLDQLFSDLTPSINAPFNASLNDAEDSRQVSPAAPAYASAYSSAQVSASTNVNANSSTNETSECTEDPAWGQFTLEEMNDLFTHLPSA